MLWGREMRSGWRVGASAVSARIGIAGFSPVGPVLVGLVLIGLAQPRPAAAQATSFRQEMNDIKNSIPGLADDHPPIDFTERAPLVVPPTNDLPPPTDTPRLGVNDPDAISRTKALSDPRRPVPPTDPGASATGANARNFLIEPPSGMQNPDAIADQAAADGFKDAPKHKKSTHAASATHRVRRTPAASASAQ